MNGDSSNTRSSNFTGAAATTTAAAASKQLQRRLNGIGRPHWSVATDVDLVQHLACTCGLVDFDILCDCILRMAAHVLQLSSSKKMEFIGPSILEGQSPLYTAVAAALQQLGQGLQQYMQQGQLPAALTERAVEACWALCSLLRFLCSCLLDASNYSVEGDLEKMRQQLYTVERQTGNSVRP
jgi:hypothetical protein